MNQSRAKQRGPDNLKPPDKQQPPSRCCGSVSRRTKILLMSLVVFLFIFTLLAYLVFIPTFIRSKVASQDLNQIRLEKMLFRDFDSQSFRFDMEATLPAQFPLPLSAELAPFTLSAAVGDATLFDVHLPKLAFTLNKEIPLNMEAETSFKSADIARVQKLISDFSSDSGLAPFELSMRAKVDISMFGITFYRGFEIDRKIPVPQVRSRIDELMAVMPEFMKRPDLSMFPL